MLNNYLKRVGLSEFAEALMDTPLEPIVAKAFAKHKEDFSKQELEKLYTYDIPKTGPNGSCSATHEKEDKPYNLSDTLGLNLADWKSLQRSSQTLRIWRLYQVVKAAMKLVGPDWFGIYRTITKVDGSKVLVKEAYGGAFSRAEFPLTEQFAKQSNNSAVGLSGKAKYFQDLLSYNGPYYECDAKVQSEFCGPILDQQGRVIGIIDAESFQKNFFTPEKVLQLTKICQDLGEINLGL